MGIYNLIHARNLYIVNISPKLKSFNRSSLE